MPGIFASFTRYFRTIRHLRAEQMLYRLYYPLKRRLLLPKISRHIPKVNNIAPGITLPASPRAHSCYFPTTQGFCFLNQRIDFGNRIDWRCRYMSRLWRFNLYYFDWLRSSDLSISDCLDSIYQFIDNQKFDDDFNHVYPTALRLRNWIYFVVRNGISDVRIDQLIYRDALLIYRFPEFEIGGNHLLESGLSLVWAGHYFDDPRMLRKASMILRRELKRQILSDGSHYERSIGYHTFIQKNIFDTICFLRHLNVNAEILKLLEINFLRMLSYAKLLMGNPQLIPHFGDSNPEMIEWNSELQTLAQNLYRKELESLVSPSEPLAMKLIDRNRFQVFFVRGFLLSPDQPGHSHADTFSFCLNFNELPCIVDPGVSSYEEGAIRNWQRSTRAHNTLFAGGLDSSELWSAFRMGERAKVFTLSESDFVIDSQHFGYFSVLGLSHRRRLEVLPDALLIQDFWETGRKPAPELRIMLHFHPERRVELTPDGVLLPDCGLRIRIEGAVPALEPYEYCLGFGKTIKAMKMNALVNRNKINTLIESING